MVINIELINENELTNIKGGTSISVWTGIIIATVVIFISGIIDGIANPSKCGDANE